jgi:spore maturation protein CgeB
MPTSYNDLWYIPMPSTEKYYGDIIFVGNNYLGTNQQFPKSQERYDMVQYLKSEFGDKFQVYGLNWGKDVKMLNPAQTIEAYNNAKIVITQNNFERKGYQSDRAFNAIGCGAFVIAQRFKGIEEQFDGTLFWWEEFEDIKSMCNNLLNEYHYRNNMATISNNVVVNNHRWVNRFEYLKQFINDRQNS